MVVSENRYNVIGTSPIRPDGVDKVTGRAQYGADIDLPRMLFGRLKRSTHAHAKILSIDTSKAEALDGVLAVATYADFPSAPDEVADLGETVAPYKWVMSNVLASDKALYHGHAVAAVCATDPHIAEDALELIDVTYEPLPPVLSVHDAMADDAPLLHDGMLTVEMIARVVPGEGRSDSLTNVASHLRFETGDATAGFEEADVIVEGEFDTAMVHQGYIEPQNGTAYWSGDDLTVWVSTQGTFAVRQQLSRLLNIPLSKVTVVPMEIGGGFGGKIPIYMEPVAAILSKKTGRPVRMSMNRTEVFTGTGPTSATYVRAKIGAKNDGTLVAAEAYLAYEAGAFPGSPVGAGAGCMFASYDIPNQLTDAYDVERTLVALANADNHVLYERRQIASHVGTRRTVGTQNPRIGAEEVMDSTIVSAHYRSELSGSNRGRGVSMGFWQNGGMESSAYAQLNSDASVNLVLGSVDIGGQRASCAMQFAETMGINYEQVNPQVVDTASVGFNGPTGGSRTTFATGWAVYNTALDLRIQMAERAAKIWEVDAGTVHYTDDGVIRGPDDNEMTFAELCRKLPSTGGLLQGQADISPSGVGPAYGCHIVDVEVDRETGKVEILRYTAIQDVGTAIHPAYVEGQIQGGVAQGIGMALNEEYCFDETGTMRNASLLDYRIPTTLDLPEIETVLVEVPNPGHPYGVRGVGEVPIVPPLAAVANAIYDAIGVRPNHLPANPTWLLEHLLDEDD